MPVVRPPASVPMRVLPRRGLPIQEARRLLDEEARAPFDLAADMTVRAAVIEIGDGEQAILFLSPHRGRRLVGGRLLPRARAAVRRVRGGGAGPALPALPIQYGDFAVWQRRVLAEGALDAKLAYWKKQLQGAPASLDFPLDRPRPEVLSVRGGARSLRLPPNLPASLHALGRWTGVTLFVTLLSAFAALLHRLSGQDDLCVGTPVAGRARLATEDLIGPFANTLVHPGRPLPGAHLSSS